MDAKSIEQRKHNLILLKKELRKMISEESNILERERNELNISNHEIKPNMNLVVKNSNVDYKCKEIVVNEMKEEDKKEYLQKRDVVSDTQFFEKIREKVLQIPSSNGSKYYSKLNIRIGIIADEFLYKSFENIAELVYITPKNYKENVDKVDMLFVASTWNGLDKEWMGAATINSKVRAILLDIIDYYKSNNIKTIFYSKEDPINYDIFLDVAKQCNYIYTTENDVIKNYKEDCKNDNVDVLCFGVNPVYHNPIGIKMFDKKKEVFFAGSWYEKYPDRNKETEMIFDGVLEGDRELKIIDRNFNLNRSRYFFPEKYLKYISPAIDHKELQNVHKLYDWSINLNTIKYSQSMFANRVYEMQALGNIVLSNYNIAINNKFPNVFLVHNKNEVKEILNGFSDDEIYRHQCLGIRQVMSNNTTFNRIEEVCDFIGLDMKPVNRNVLVVADKINDVVIEMFKNQTYLNKRLISIDEFSEEVKDEHDIVAFFNSNNKYDMFYLEDMINAFKYTNCDYITKDSYVDDKKLKIGVEHNYVKEMNDKYKTVFWAKKFSAKELIDMTKENIENGYSIDHFEFVENYVEDKLNKDNITYKMSVIIAAYNNGNHLLSKCFNSLRRSTMFNDMEIIIVDDGSTDGYTERVVKYIEGKYSNVKSYLYGDGGSGSASRPRNKGFEMSTTKYITYLDPDNEAVNDGYTKLYNEIISSNHDLVVGGMYKVDTGEMAFNFHNVMLQHNNRKDVLEGDSKLFLEKSKFYVMSIQALIFKRELIEKNQLKMIEGVFGEDTIFFQELMLVANSVKAINTQIHIYYAAVEGSSVNDISVKFYQRYLTLEKLRIEKYRQYNILESYIKSRFDFYVKNWYFEKLKRVKKAEIIPAIKVLEEILDLYTYYTKYEECEISEFYKACKNKKYEGIAKKYIGD